LNCTFEAEQHPLVWQMIHKSRIPKPGELAYPTIMIGDGAHFITNMLKIGTPNPMKFLDECTARASEILTKFLPALRPGFYPGLCYVMWQRKNLGGAPIWPMMKYEIETMP
jgi:hypothetical protein